MSKEDFEKKFNELKNKYKFFWKESCDFFPLADLIIYKNENDEEPILVIQIHDEVDREKGIESLKEFFNNN